MQMRRKCESSFTVFWEVDANAWKMSEQLLLFFCQERPIASMKNTHR